MRTISSVRRTTALIILGMICVLPACKKSNSTITGSGTYTPLDLPAGSHAVTNASNTFALNIFQQVLQADQATTNKLISPLSIYLALSMTYNGAAGATLDSMAGTLGLAGVPTAQLDEVSQALLQQLPKEDNKVQLSLANSIWYEQGGPQPAPAFLNTAQTDYLGLVQSLDFTNPASVNTINSWVAKNTDNYIPTIINQLNPSDLMLLINAIYFNGAWLNAFQAGKTQNQLFHLTDGSTVSVPFMNQTVSIRASVSSALTLAELPYGTGKAYDMYLAIPTSTGMSIDDFAASFDEGTLASAISQLDTVDAALTIPKWNYSYAVNQMAPELSQLGMSIAFGGDADFSNMYPSAPVNISQVIHKTYIKVSEEGTQAAAATAVVFTFSLSPGGHSGPIPIVADHPFVYLIVEKQTGTILFIGVVNDPSQN
jgi:serine protease inhibitor